MLGDDGSQRGVPEDEERRGASEADRDRVRAATEPVSGRLAFEANWESEEGTSGDPLSGWIEKTLQSIFQSQIPTKAGHGW